MWDFFSTVRHRHSIRTFRKDIPVEPEKLHAMLEMACAAPSAGDLQSYQIIVVQSQDGRDALAKAAAQSFIADAPLCLVFCSDPHRAEQKYGERGSGLFAVQDATIAATYAQLAAVAAEMSSTWVGSFDEEEIARQLHLDAGLVPVAILSVGYPAEIPELTPRRHLSEMVQYR